MRNLDELLIRDWLVPESLSTRILYHYTTAAGLIGILNSGMLRGSNATFLNDSSEIAFGRSICHQVLMEELKHRTDLAERKLIENARGFLDDEPPHEIYVTSFSARRDLLSQWRAYGSSESRFCVGFRAAQFSERDILRFPQPVDYVRDSQQEKVRRAVAIACRELSRSPDDPYHGQSCALDLSFHLRRLSCAFKHAGFAEEEEWRSVERASPISDLRSIGFEVTGGVLRTFISMLMGSRVSDRLPVSEVCLGPSGQKQRETIYTIQLLLARYGYEDASVTTSEIPFVG